MNMMTRHPDHNDADLILKLYDLRREAVMRQARHFMMVEFAPKRLQDVQEILAKGHPQNDFFRQVTSYWEMAASFVNRKILNAELFADNCGEALFLFAKLEPFLDELRKTYRPNFLKQIDTAIQEHQSIQDKYQWIRNRKQN